jgi:hypothetical protein
LNCVLLKIRSAEQINASGGKGFCSCKFKIQTVQMNVAQDQAK